MALIVQTPPAVEPVTVQQAKGHCVIEHGLDDALVASMIRTAREHTENTIGRALITQTLRAVFDSFPAQDCITLERSPVQSVTFIKYIDADGIEQTFPSTSYSKDLLSSPARIALKRGQVWPITDEDLNTVTIEYVAGYGATGDKVPGPIIQGILFLVAHLYANREIYSPGVQLFEVPETYDWCVLPYKVW